VTALQSATIILPQPHPMSTPDYRLPIDTSPLPFSITPYAPTVYPYALRLCLGLDKLA